MVASPLSMKANVALDPKVVIRAYRELLKRSIYGPKKALCKQFAVTYGQLERLLSGKKLRGMGPPPKLTPNVQSQLTTILHSGLVNRDAQFVSLLSSGGGPELSR